MIKQNSEFINRLSKKTKITSIFDVGCGCGANLFLFKNDGIKIGGMDYSSSQIEIAKKLFDKKEITELICGEAIDLPTDIKYDAIISNSVFSYFPNEEYAKAVLDKMVDKALHSIGLIDIHDLEKKDLFTEYRRETIENYDERYKELHKYFYRKDFFHEYANERRIEVEFSDSNVEGYWNNEFVFDVFFYKK